MLLGQNQLVDILISGIESTDGDILNDISSSFSTTFGPLYSTPNKIRAIAGSYVKDISDDALLYLIHIYSVEADNLATCAKTSFSKWQYFASQWVTYSAALNAIYNADIYVGVSGQKIYKKLGDFSISKDGTGKDSNPAHGIIDKLECEIFKLIVSVKFCREPLTSCDKGVSSNDLRNGVAAQLTVKGGDLPRPMFGRTFFSSGRHPGMTGYIKILDRYRLTNAQPCNPFPPHIENNGYQ